MTRLALVGAPLPVGSGQSPSEARGTREAGGRAAG